VESEGILAKREDWHSASVADPPKVGSSPITIYRMKTGRLRVVRKPNPRHNQEEETKE